MLEHICGRSFCAFLIGSVLASPCVGQSDADREDTVVQDGRRLPTKITPPPPRPASRAVPVQNSAQAEPGASAAKPSGDEADAEAQRRLQAQRWERRVVREYGLGGYRVYRDRDAVGVGVLQPVGPGWGPPDPFTLQAALDEAYAAGREDERYYSTRSQNQREMDARKARVLSKHGQALQAALSDLRSGNYAQAVIGLTLAAKLDQGDPACRLHLAQARLALGHYQDAALALRRALQLQPKLVYVNAQLDRYYPEEGCLARFRDALRAAQSSGSSTREVHFLRGFVEFQCGDLAAARAAFLLASDEWPRDELTRDYLEITKPPR